MIDAHVHFWKYNKIKDAWITNEMLVLQKDYLPENLKPILEENEVEGVIAVQADQSEIETSFLTELVRENSIIKGVVGWVDLQDKNVEERLSYYSKYPIIKGFRHIVQSEEEGFFTKKIFFEWDKNIETIWFHL